MPELLAAGAHHHHANTQVVFVGGIMHSGTTIATTLLIEQQGVIGSTHEMLPSHKESCPPTHANGCFQVLKCPCECDTIAACYGRPGKYMADLQIRTLRSWPNATIIYMRRDPADLLLSHARRDALNVSHASAKYFVQRWQENRAIDERWMRFVDERTRAAVERGGGGRTLVYGLEELARSPLRYVESALAGGADWDGGGAAYRLSDRTASHRPTIESGSFAHTALRRWQKNASVTPEVVRVASEADLRMVLATVIDATSETPETPETLRAASEADLRITLARLMDANLTINSRSAFKPLSHGRGRRLADEGGVSSPRMMADSASSPDLLPPLPGSTAYRVLVNGQPVPATWAPPAHADETVRVLLVGDSNDRFLIHDVGNQFKLRWVMPSPMDGACVDHGPGLKYHRTIPTGLRNTGCGLATGSGLDIGNIVLTGTVLFADQAVTPPRGASAYIDFWSQYVNTTQPLEDAARAFDRWPSGEQEVARRGATPARRVLVSLHSSLRDLYHLCRRAAPGASEAVAAKAFLARPASLSEAEAATYLSNLGRLMHATRRVFASNARTHAVFTVRTMPPVLAQANPCFADASVTNSYLVGINGLLRRFARTHDLALMDWDRWVRHLPGPHNYSRPSTLAGRGMSAGPHVDARTMVAFFQAMMWWYHRTVLHGHTPD